MICALGSVAAMALAILNPVRILLIGAASAGACLLAKTVLGGTARQGAAPAVNASGVVPFTQGIAHVAAIVLPYSILIALAAALMTVWPRGHRRDGGERDDRSRTPRVAQ
jgi:hypothetical protein